MISASIRIKVVENKRGKIAVEYTTSNVRFGKTPTERERQALIRLHLAGLMAIRDSTANSINKARAFCAAGTPLQPRNAQEG